jgi:hypothetical protein
MKDKFGNKLTWKQFMHRWKEGIEGVTALQQVKGQIYSTWIIVLGLLFGIIICIIGIRNLWWLLIILVGGLGNTLFQLLGLWQKKNILSGFEIIEKEVTENE